ncbi:hypothetical protein cyc_06503 [Cyclospora cayetanensis]|uniref:Uncharacterized protein n=1 Tax=Cyclospora cayetanensis TaxID=88456 RepID=A0A1D3D6V5_9EIME|nr:hypothetical protein cyc_06503 [Cyclospora cayetanensis]
MTQREASLDLCVCASPRCFYDILELPLSLPSAAEGGGWTVQGVQFVDCIDHESGVYSFLHESDRIREGPRGTGIACKSTGTSPRGMQTQDLRTRSDPLRT